MHDPRANDALNFQLEQDVKLWPPMRQQLQDAPEPSIITHT